MVCTMISDEEDHSRLKHYVLYHIHQDKTDEQDLHTIAREFVQINECRINLFGKY